MVVVVAVFVLFSPSFLALPAIVCAAPPGTALLGGLGVHFPFFHAVSVHGRAALEQGAAACRLCSQRSRNVPGQPARGEGVGKLRWAGNRCLNIAVGGDVLVPGNTKICVSSSF